MVYIKEIGKNIWPGYKKPFKEELFSSWLFRVSREHQIKMYSFCKESLGGIPVMNRDIDLVVNRELKNIIINHTPLKTSEVDNLFLNSYEGYLFEKINPNGRTYGILPLGIYHRKRTRRGLLYCSECFKEGKHYFKKQWRLLTSILCLECNCYLQDFCPRCKSPIIFHRLDIGEKNTLSNLEIFICFNCNYDLRKSNNIHVCSKFDIEYQQNIDDILNNGFNEITHYSFTYFKILFHLCNLFSSTSKKYNKFKNFYDRRNSSISRKGISEFTYLDLISRRKLLVESFNTMKCWPQNFIKLCTEEKVNYSDFWREHKNELPYWVFKVLKLDV
ncbi:TniQ family protein [Tenacibaculum sp. SDUM215027]|uniref:TniQ family protein n=1 Tax=Tenacibaculum sp. SDUM215027 TaxID=3422596 RepID=UPI003D31E7DD